MLGDGKARGRQATIGAGWRWTMPVSAGYARGAKHWLVPGVEVVSNAFGRWSALAEAACGH